LSRREKIKIVHIIAALNVGGTEMMLYKLLSRMRKDRFENFVFTLKEKGSLSEDLESQNIRVYNAGGMGGILRISALIRSLKILREINPDIIQGWLVHGNLVAQIASIFLPYRLSTLWNIRYTALPKGETKRSILFIMKLLSILSFLPQKIVFNSKAGADDHIRMGYRRDKSCIIPNGFDTKLFSPSVKNRRSVRLELNIPEEAILIGLIGRFDPLKDHRCFLKAGAMLLSRKRGIFFLLAGREVDWQNRHLIQLIEKLGISGKVFLLGERKDVPRITAALDIAACSSVAEGFSNVIGEAMSCGISCVVTDVGDSAWLVGDSGIVVPPRNHQALCEAWLKLIELGSAKRRVLGERARKRIEDHFSIQMIVKKYEQLYEDILLPVKKYRKWDPKN
jgi:glycosyltransferase involved in cell wall biosynthesis